MIDTKPEPSPNSLEPTSAQSKFSRWEMVFLGSILLLGIVVRLAWRIHQGSADFWARGYTMFTELAANFVSGKGFCLTNGRCAVSMPLYPAFLAMLTPANKNYLWIVVPQALMGAGTVLCAYLIGRELFGKTVAAVAGVLTCLYPYYVINDTRLQSTGMFTFFTSLAVFALLRASRSYSVITWTLAGFALGAACLTRQTLLPFAGIAIIWLGLFGKSTRGKRFDRFLAIGLPVGLLVGYWLARNYMQVGSPVVTSTFGQDLWLANNSKTFSHYPAESLDRSAADAMAAVSPAERQKLDGMADEILRSDWFEQRAIDYLWDHPLDTILNAGRKIVVGFSWIANPDSEPIGRTTYFLSYAPILILGLAGMILTRRWKDYALIYLLFLTFVGVTAILSADTNQRSFLDVYLIVFAAYGLNRIFAVARNAPAIR